MECQGFDVTVIQAAYDGRTEPDGNGTQKKECILFHITFRTFHQPRDREESKSLQLCGWDIGSDAD